MLDRRKGRVTDRTQIIRDSSPWDSVQGKLDEAQHGLNAKGKLTDLHDFTYTYRYTYSCC